MGFDTKSIVKDVNGKPVPQYWNPETDQYEVIESTDGKLKVTMVDAQGNEIQSQSLVDQIEDKLDDLIVPLSIEAAQIFVKAMNIKLDELIEVVK